MIDFLYFNIVLSMLTKTTVKPSNGVTYFFIGLIDIYLVSDSIFIHLIRGYFFHRKSVNSVNWVRSNGVNQVNQITPIKFAELLGNSPNNTNFNPISLKINPISQNAFFLIMHYLF